MLVGPCARHQNATIPYKTNEILLGAGDAAVTDVNRHKGARYTCEVSCIVLRVSIPILTVAGRPEIVVILRPELPARTIMTFGHDQAIRVPLLQILENLSRVRLPRLLTANGRPAVRIHVK